MSKHSLRGLLLIMLALLPSIHGAGAQTVPTGFTYEFYVAGPFNGEPIAFAFLPDGRQILLERNTGGVRLAAVDAGTSTLLLNVPGVASDGERGLLGVAVDPSWPTRPYVYFYYTHDSGFSYVTMYTAAGDLTVPSSTNMTLSTPFHLLTDIPDNHPLHNAGTLRFGLDGMLYVSLGEDSDICQAQDLGDLRGTILRLDVSGMPQPGSGPPAKADITPGDNPFPGPDTNEQLIWAWGLRNPFRFTIDAETGDVIIGDVGGMRFEEINVVTAAGGGGENFGWPQREGPVDPGYGETCGENNAFAEAIFSYGHDEILPNAIVGGPRTHAVVGSGVSLPPSYDGSIFFADWGLSVIRRIIDDGSGWQLAPRVPGQASADDWGRDITSITDLQQGPDGALYVMRHSVARGLYRIRASEALDVEPYAHGDRLVRVAPNPLRAEGAVFEWDLTPGVAGGPLSLRILDVAGRTVRRLREGLPPGGQLRWNGRDAGSRPLPAGVYFWRLDREDHRAAATGKITIVR